MVINNVIVQYNGGFLPYILLLTQAHIFVWFDGTIIIVCYYFYYHTLLNTSYYVLQYLLFRYASWLCMVTNISVQYNGGLLFSPTLYC